MQIYSIWEKGYGIWDMGYECATKKAFLRENSFPKSLVPYPKRLDMS